MGKYATNGCSVCIPKSMRPGGRYCIGRKLFWAGRREGNPALVTRGGEPGENVLASRVGMRKGWG
jgi:hypothetical protein